MIPGQPDTKLLLEMSIIGLCLTEPGAYMQLANVLTPFNFQDWQPSQNLPSDNRLIWKSFGEIYPDKQINLVTTAHHMRTRYNKNLGYWLTKSTINPCSQATAFTYAFMLLEMDIIQKFGQLLLQVYNDTPAENAMHRGAVMDSYKMITEEQSDDVLFTIQAVVLFLKSLNLDEVSIDTLQEFLNTIDQKAFQIKKSTKLNTMIEAILRYADYQPNPTTKESITLLSEMIGILFLSGKSTPALNNQLLTLKSQLLSV